MMRAHKMLIAKDFLFPPDSFSKGQEKRTVFNNYPSVVDGQTFYDPTRVFKNVFRYKNSDYLHGKSQN